MHTPSTVTTVTTKIVNWTVIHSDDQNSVESSMEA